jgi:hypothetical protein
MKKLANNQADAPEIFDAMLRRRFGKTICFLCGCKLTPKNRTEEHVFPKWLQRKFKLWDHRLTLLNQTKISYRLLTIPACKECNGKYLSPLENQMRRALEGGVAGVKALSKSILFFWLGKILYGLLYREHLLPLKRAEARNRPIVPREALRRFKLHHYFLQGCRVPMVFETGLPASMLIVHTQAPRRLEFQFDFRDAPLLLLVSIRIGKVGILATLQDGGALSTVSGWDKFKTFRFHPDQFKELTAQFFYQARLINRTPKFMITEQEGVIHVIQAGLAGLSAKPIFDPWVQGDYARILSDFMGIPLADLNVPPDKVRSMIVDANGNIHFIDVRADPDYR